MVFQCPVAAIEHFIPQNVSAATQQTDKIINSLVHTGPSSMVIASILLGVSVFILLLGKKLIKPTLILTSGFTATVVSFVFIDALMHAAHASPQVRCGVDMGVPIVLGLVAGLLAWKIFQLGIALLGAGASCGLGYMSYLLFLHKIKSPPVGSFDVTFVVTMSVCGLVGMLVLLKFQKTLLIL